jgi:mono/diheme cytochrome c family protein
MKKIYTTFVLSVSAALLTSGAVHAGGANDHTHEGAHQHDSWEPPPAEYSKLQYDNWDSETSAAKGARIYQQKCLVCHGQDGKGTGPVAASLRHPPADLTSHFHTAPGNGDGYLFWRISEGGMVEPFRSQKSAMPAFKSSLTEKQRWDVLTYIHQEFHQGFPEPSTHTDMPAKEMNHENHKH